MGQEIEKRVVEENVKFVCLQFTDVTGAVKSVDIPAGQLGRALEDGVWFDGSSVEGFARIQESDMRLILDPETFAVLPWTQPERRRARVFCDIYRPDGEPFPGDPRGVLKRVLKRLEGAAGTSTSGRSRSSSCCGATVRRASTPCRTTSAGTSTSPPPTKRSACAAS